MHNSLLCLSACSQLPTTPIGDVTRGKPVTSSVKYQYCALYLILIWLIWLISRNKLFWSSFEKKYFFKSFIFSRFFATGQSLVDVRADGRKFFQLIDDVMRTTLAENVTWALETLRDFLWRQRAFVLETVDVHVIAPACDAHAPTSCVLRLSNPWHSVVHLAAEWNTKLPNSRLKKR